MGKMKFFVTIGHCKTCGALINVEEGDKNEKRVYNCNCKKKE